MDIHRFDWVPGVGLYGIWRAYEVTGREAYLDFLIKWAKLHLQQAYDQKTVNSTAPLLTIVELYRKTGEEEYLKVCVDMAKYIMTEASLTIDGGLEHTVTENGAHFGNQMWADTLFMVCIFLAKLGSITGNRDYTDFAVGQLVLHYKLLWSQEAGLFYHGWDGNLCTHLSGVYWGRANAWILYSTVEILKEAGEFEGREMVLKCLRGQVDSLAGWQRRNGLFGTILDDPEAYDELSATAGIVCGIQRGVKAGYLEDSALEVARKAYPALPAYVDENGNVLSVSSGTPIMESALQYKQVPVTPTLYGQSLMCLALAEISPSWYQFD